MLISTGQLGPEALAGKVALVTGSGGGIGIHAVRALVWLGAYVIIAEINAKLGKSAQRQIEEEFGPGRARFIEVDVGDVRSISRLKRQVEKVDILINNATMAPIGGVTQTSIKDWDTSYRANLRGPVLLAQTFLPGMLKRNEGVFVTVSSEGLAYMGAYESLKAAQTHLGRTLDAELEGTGVIAFTIGPGLIRTATAMAAIERLAPLYGLSLDAFYEMNKEQILTAEEAGTAYAAAVALAPQFRGQEIGSRQALLAAGISFGEATQAVMAPIDLPLARDLLAKVRQTLLEQSQGWQERSVFERQWLLRDFKKNAGMPVDQWLEVLDNLEAELENPQGFSLPPIPLSRLAGFYGHMQDLARGYTKDPVELARNLQIVQQWQDDAEALARVFEENYQ